VTGSPARCALGGFTVNETVAVAPAATAGIRTGSPIVQPDRAARGRRYGDRVMEPLPADVASVLDALLDEADPAHALLRRQIPHLRVSGRCTCGCGTAYFELDTAAVESAPSGPGTVVAAEFQIYLVDGECPGEVLVFAENGYLSWLEVCSWSDTVDVTLATVQQSLRR